MNQTITTLLTLFMLISNDSMHAMLCKLAPKATISRSMAPHKHCHTTTNNHDTPIREIKISLFCRNRLQEIDDNASVLTRYFELKFQDPAIQLQSAGKPSLIIEEHKYNAPQINTFNMQNYLNKYLPSIYRALDHQFEQRYNETGSNFETKDRIRGTFSCLKHQKALEINFKKANNRFKMHFIKMDFNYFYKPITVSIAANGDITIVADTSQE